jgi:hypothetical protein
VNGIQLEDLLQEIWLVLRHVFFSEQTMVVMTRADLHENLPFQVEENLMMFVYVEFLMNLKYEALSSPHSPGGYHQSPNLMNLNVNVLVKQSLGPGAVESLS